MKCFTGKVSFKSQNTPSKTVIVLSAGTSMRPVGLTSKSLPDGPQVNNRALRLAGKIQFHAGGNTQEAFDAR